MAATEDGPAVLAHPLDPERLDGLLALSGAAGWNQDADDWAHMLAAGRGWGLSQADGTLVASTVVLPYGPADGLGGGFAWVSMVLVLPQCRGRGHASRLLREALGWLSARGLVPVLDATPAGHPVYRREGFVDAWALARHAREGGAPAPRAAVPEGLRIEPLREAHWAALQALDAPAFGGDRSALLRALGARAPRLAHVALRDGAVTGYVLGRPGRGATQLGPLVATDAATGVALLDAALAAAPGRVLADAPDRQDAMHAALRARGFAVQRPFTRMLHAGDAPAAQARAPGDPSTLRLIAGPELG
ncbi:MAG: GNAT family N-acetyltransferase [Burkholderiales bacterium]|nr:GNAT family N-acetyltransferase [Burkholderiales bacterium]